LETSALQGIPASFSQGDLPRVYLIEWMQTNVVRVTELCQTTLGKLTYSSFHTDGQMILDDSSKTSCMDDGESKYRA